MDLVGQIDEQAVLDNAGDGRQLSGQIRGVLNDAKFAVEHDVAVVGDDRAVLALGRPKRRLAVQRDDLLGGDRPRGRQYLHGNGVVESVGELSGIDDDQQFVGRGVDDLFPGVGRAAALDQLTAGDLIGAVDRYVDTVDFVKVSKGNSCFDRQLP